MNTLQAEKVAVKEYRNRSGRRAAKVSVVLVTDNKQEWVFAVEDAVEPPRPGSDLYVTINKTTGEMTSWWGK
ncbi:MAG TPA: hypothetical protein VGD52_05085 [Pseudoduganella sp.]